MLKVVKGELQILFGGKPVQDVYLAVVRIINSGNMPIVSADYERLVSLSFGESAQVLTAEISNTNPESLQAVVSTENNKVVLEPVLMKSGDSITFNMLVSQFSGQIKVDGRIVGVKSIRMLSEGRTKYFILTLIGTALILIGMILLTKKIPSRLPYEQSIFLQYWYYSILLVLGYLLLLVGMFRYQRLRKRLRSKILSLFPFNMDK